MNVVTDDMVQAALDAYSENEWRTSASAMRAALAAATPPATVAALVEALEAMASAADHENWHLDCVLAKALSDARAALALYRGEAGR